MDIATDLAQIKKLAMSFTTKRKEPPERQKGEYVCALVVLNVTIDPKVRRWRDIRLVCEFQISDTHRAVAVSEYDTVAMTALVSREHCWVIVVMFAVDSMFIVARNKEFDEENSGLSQ